MIENPYIQEAGIERYTGYCPGGYHPVHLGDRFNDGQYTVVNKLGYGSYSTVWLVRDEVKESYASLKILTADASKYSSGTELDVLRRSITGQGDGKRFVLQFLDTFSHDGPNGNHLCIVTEVSGPNLATSLWGFDGEEELTPQIARAFVIQAAKGVEYLHSCNIVHGDLHLGNFLYHLPALSHLQSQEDIEKYFGAPETTSIRIVEGLRALHDIPHIPRYVVFPPDYSTFFEQIFTNPSQAELKICDFSESSLHDPVQFPDGFKRKMNCPNVHAAPEVIFDDLASPASDIWALGNTIHQILTGAGTECLTAIPGRPGCSRNEVVRELVRLFGRLPERWWNRWDERSKYFDDEGCWIGDTTSNEVLAKPGSKISEAFLPGEQKERFQRLLSRIFVYEPKARLTARGLFEELASLISSGDESNAALGA